MNVEASPLFMFVMVVTSVSLLGAFIWWRTDRHRRHSSFPPVTDSEILYAERNVSGRSHRSVVSKFLAFNNCLNLTVTADEFWISSWSALEVLSRALGMEQRIRKADIERVVAKRFLMAKWLEVHFRERDGKTTQVDLRLRKSSEFLEALRQNATFSVESYD